MKEHNQQWYLKKVRECLMEIATLHGKEPERFLLLKKKAQKYLLKARQMENQNQQRQP